MVRVFAVRVGDKYGPDYEDYLRSKIPDIDFIRVSMPQFIRQWNKIRFFNKPLNEAICVIDVDVELTNDYMELFEYPIERGQFLSIPTFNDTDEWRGYKLNGGFYKFFPKDTKYIYEEFVNNSRKWTTHYIENGTTVGPVNGEQFFVEDMVKQRLELKLVPEDWVQRGQEGKFIDDGIVKLVHHSFRNAKQNNQ